MLNHSKKTKHSNEISFIFVLLSTILNIDFNLNKWFSHSDQNALKTLKHITIEAQINNLQTCRYTQTHKHIFTNKNQSSCMSFNQFNTTKT